MPSGESQEDRVVNVVRAIDTAVWVQEPDTVEIVARDGATFRVIARHGEKASCYEVSFEIKVTPVNSRWEKR